MAENLPAMVDQRSDSFACTAIDCHYVAKGSPYSNRGRRITYPEMGEYSDDVVWPIFSLPLRFSV